MDSCRWASYMGEAMSKIDENVIALPEDQQVSRGMELMSMLRGQALESKAPEVAKGRVEGADLENVSWNVIVKQTFIEVVMPACNAARKRAMSEGSALACFDRPEEAWESLVPGKLQDMSDASTDVSLEAEDLEHSGRQLEDLDASFGGSTGQTSGREDVGWSSEGEVDQEALAPATLPYQYVESWWMPTDYGTCSPAMPADYGAGSPSMCSPSTNGFDQAGMGFGASTFVPMQWVHPSMSAVDCHGIDTASAPPQEWRTTVMIRNMPNNYTLEMLLELVDSMGFAGHYDFAYLPIDFQSQAGLGYAFVNFTNVADAQLCFSQLEGFTNWRVPSDKVCTVTWSSPTQGFEEHVDRYRNSPVMHPSLPDEWKPVLFHQGMRIRFPPPTKAIKTPKIRSHASGKPNCA